MLLDASCRRSHEICSRECADAVLRIDAVLHPEYAARAGAILDRPTAQGLLRLQADRTCCASYRR